MNYVEVGRQSVYDRDVLGANGEELLKITKGVQHMSSSHATAAFRRKFHTTTMCMKSSIQKRQSGKTPGCRLGDADQYITSQVPRKLEDSSGEKFVAVMCTKVAGKILRLGKNFRNSRHNSYTWREY
ncbi:hypothetical protein RUM44_011054 [Polyplax serrata]|uniref:Uncharacterized protein n=1 Tax=Polyplax serrata TaxID=468196 RepID=A0ABR1AP32_POLSC